MKEVALLSKSEKEISLFIRTSKVNKKGVVLINTGTCIPQQIYWKFADFLSLNGYDAITYDYADAQNFSSNVSHIDWLKDMETALDYVLTHYPNDKKYIVGHSSGGQLLGYMPNANKFDKLFLIASAHAYWKKMSPISGYAMQLFWKILVPINIKFNGYFNNKMYGVSGGFPKNIILELRSFCQNKDFFFPFFESKNVQNYYNEITCPVKAYHLGDDIVANRISCEDMLLKYKNASKSIETLNAKDYGLSKFGHRGFFAKKANESLWPKFLKDLEA
jgi:predicted alpha/beta hydrolase